VKLLHSTPSCRLNWQIGRRGHGSSGNRANPACCEGVKIPGKGGSKGSNLHLAGGLLRRSERAQGAEGKPGSLGTCGGNLAGSLHSSSRSLRPKRSHPGKDGRASTCTAVARDRS